MTQSLTTRLTAIVLAAAIVATAWAQTVIVPLASPAAAAAATIA